MTWSTSAQPTANPSICTRPLTAEEALHAYTLGSAHAAFDENIKGSIATGKLADLTVLDRDITTTDPAAIDQTKVLATMVAGSFEFGSYT